MEKHPETKSDVYQHPPLDVAMESSDELVIEKKGTRRDVNDMARMGKLQVLRVRLLIRCFELSLKQRSAQFWFLFDPRVLHGLDGFLGSPIRVYISRPRRLVAYADLQVGHICVDKRRHCRCYIHISFRLSWLRTCSSLNG